MYLTAFMAILDPKTGKLSFVSAGHDFPLVVRKNGEMEELKPTGPAIGVFEDRKFAIGEVQFEREDGLLVYTDGLLDLRNKDGKSFGGQNLRSLVAKKPNDIGTLISEIVSQADGFSSGAAQYDDITVLGLLRMP
jgi:sigma-B regulation protein RsbU (phosphoserine phosphatase)